MIEFYDDRRKFSRNRNWKRIEMSQVQSVATKISMSKQIAQLAIRTKKENYVAIEIGRELR